MMFITEAKMIWHDVAHATLRRLRHYMLSDDMQESESAMRECAAMRNVCAQDGDMPRRSAREAARMRVRDAQRARCRAR